MNESDKISIKKKLEKFINKNIKSGQDICLHTDLIKLNKIFEFKSPKQLFNFTNQLFTSKTRTLLLPAFSFSWGADSKSKVYDKNNSKSKLGFISEYIRKNKIAPRTNDPMFSFYIFGKKKNYMHFKDDTFGKGSIFESMHKNNCKIVMLNTNNFGSTFIHYIEQYYNDNFEKIGYRYKKNFFGTIKTSNRLKHNKTVVFSRKMKNNLIFNDKKILQLLKKNKKINKIKFNNMNISSVDSNDLFFYGVRGLIKDKFFFVENEK